MFKLALRFALFVLACVGGASGQTFNGAHTYWRVNITAITSSNNIQLAEIAFYDSNGTAIANTGCTATASSPDATYIPSNAFDGNTGNLTVLDAAPPPTQWLQCHYPSAISPASFAITSRGGCCDGNAPMNLNLASSDDGSAWTTVGSWVGASFLSPSTFMFTIANEAPATTAVYYRLSVTSTPSGGALQIAQWKLFDAVGNPITTTRVNAFASSYDGGITGPYGAFDSVTTNTFFAAGANPSVGVPNTLDYGFDTVVAVKSFSLKSRTDSFNATNMPSTFSLQKSTDRTNWTVVQSFTAATWNSGSLGQVQTFTLSSFVPGISPIVVGE